MILTIGSLNIDHVYQVEEISRPGETIHCLTYSRFCGGKGLNQSVAVARAGAQVIHAGCTGAEGLWLVSLLAEEAVDVSLIETLDVATGHAIIQVSEQGENSIVVFGGANQCLTATHLEECFKNSRRPQYLLLQNETNVVREAMIMAHAQVIPIAYNPAPMDDDLWSEFPMEYVAVLFVNETEGATLAGSHKAMDILDSISTRLPHTKIVLTQGSQGAICRQDNDTFSVPGIPVGVVDTTAAGDTFVGYCLAELAKGRDLRQAVSMANRAAAVCVTRRGAAPSIPYISELSSGEIPNSDIFESGR